MILQTGSENRNHKPTTFNFFSVTAHKPVAKKRLINLFFTLNKDHYYLMSKICKKFFNRASYSKTVSEKILNSKKRKPVLIFQSHY